MREKAGSLEEFECRVRLLKRLKDRNKVSDRSQAADGGEWGVTNYQEE